MQESWHGLHTTRPVRLSGIFHQDIPACRRDLSVFVALNVLCVGKRLLHTNGVAASRRVRMWKL